MLNSKFKIIKNPFSQFLRNIFMGFLLLLISFGASFVVPNLFNSNKVNEDVDAAIWPDLKGTAGYHYFYVAILKSDGSYYLADPSEVPTGGYIVETSNAPKWSLNSANKDKNSPGWDSDNRYLQGTKTGPATCNGTESTGDNNSYEDYTNGRRSVWFMWRNIAQGFYAYDVLNGISAPSIGSNGKLGITVFTTEYASLIDQYTFMSFNAFRQSYAGYSVTLSGINGSNGVVVATENNESGEFADQRRRHHILVLKAYDYTVSFDVNANASTGDPVDRTLTFRYGQEPNSTQLGDSSIDKNFMGYYNESGIQYYDANGNRCTTYTDPITNATRTLRWPAKNFTLIACYEGEYKLNYYIDDEQVGNTSTYELQSKKLLGANIKPGYTVKQWVSMADEYSNYSHVVPILDCDAAGCSIKYTSGCSAEYPYGYGHNNCLYGLSKAVNEGARANRTQEIFVRTYSLQHVHNTNPTTHTDTETINLKNVVFVWMGYNGRLYNNYLRDFIPIGFGVNGGVNNYNTFRSVFDGRGMQIESLQLLNVTQEIAGSSDLSSYYTSHPYWGLFGKCNDGDLKNITINNLQINFSSPTFIDESYVGGIAGYATNIKNCIVRGSLTGGRNLFGNYSYITTSGAEYIGGIAGYANNIKNCISDVKIEAYNPSADIIKVGGLAGQAWIGVSNCVGYGTININSTGYVGGLIGDNNSSLTSCFAGVAISGINTTIGSVVGHNRPSGNISYCFSNKNTYGCIRLNNGTYNSSTCAIAGGTYQGKSISTIQPIYTIYGSRYLTDSNGLYVLISNISLRDYYYIQRESINGTLLLRGGIFEGCGNVIQGVYDDDFQLFDSTSTGTLRNVILTNFKNTSSDIGGMVSQSDVTYTATSEYTYYLQLVQEATYTTGIHGGVYPGSGYVNDYILGTPDDEDVWWAFDYPTNSNFNFKAIYKYNHYTIVYDDGVDDNSVSGSMANSYHEYQSPKALNQNAFARLDYDFDGWYCEAYNLYFADGEVINIPTLTDNEVITLTAVWKTWEVTVVPNFGDDGYGSNAESGDFVYDDELKNGSTIYNGSFESSVGDDWALNPYHSQSVTSSLSSEQAKSGSYSLKNVYNPASGGYYRVGYNWNGAADKTYVISGSVLNNTNLPLNVYLQQEASDGSWPIIDGVNITNDNKWHNFEFTVLLPSNTLSSYLYFGPGTEFTGAYYIDDISIYEQNSTYTPYEQNYASNSVKRVLTKVTRPGYNFVGYNSDANATRATTTGWYDSFGGDGTAEDITLYAIWEKINTITFNYNGAYQNMVYNHDFNLLNTVDYNWDDNINGTKNPWGWSTYNGGVEASSVGYHAHVYNLNGDNVIRLKSNDDYDGNTGVNDSGVESVVTTNRWQAASTSTYVYRYQPGKSYVVIIDMMRDSGERYIWGGPYYKTESNSTSDFYSGNPNYIASILGEWSSVRNTLTMASDALTFESFPTYFYGHTGANSTVYLDNVRIYEVGSEIDTETITYTNSKVEAMLPSAVKEGYTFKGWKVTSLSGTATSGGKTLAVGSVIEYIDSGSAADISLEPVWEANKYHAMYDTMGGTVDSSYKTVTYNSTYGTLPTPTKEGYAFIGWYLEETFETLVVSTTNVSITQDHTLYAKWEKLLEINYSHSKVTNATNFTVSVTNGTASKTTISYGESSYITPTDVTNFSVTITRTNTNRKYYFDYAYDESHAGSGYDTKTLTFNNNQSKLIALSVIECMNVEAVKGDEGIDTATFNWYWNNNPQEDTNKTFLSDVLHSGKIVYNATVKEGYEFDGWYNGNTKVSSDLTYTIESITEDITLTARTTANTYTVTLNANGGTVDPTSVNVTYNAKYGELPTAAKEGYAFTGWYLEETFETLVGSDTVITTASDHTLYAKWTPAPLSINYVYKNTANATNIAISVTNGSVSSTSIAYNETAIVTPTDATNFTVTLSRTNTSRNYYVDIYDGTWSSMTNEKTITFGTDRASFIRLNVHEYMNVNAVKGDEGIDTATFDYYWNNKLQYEARTSSTTVLHTGKIVYDATVKEGYEFDGWYNGNTKVSSDLTYTIESITEDATLTARTTTNTYTITLDPMGGTVDPTEIEVAYNSIYGTLPTPTKEGYIFTGWYTNNTSKNLFDVDDFVSFFQSKKSSDLSFNAETGVLNIAGSYGATTTTTPTTFFYYKPNIPKGIYTISYIGWCPSASAERTTTGIAPIGDGYKYVSGGYNGLTISNKEETVYTATFILTDPEKWNGFRIIWNHGDLSYMKNISLVAENTTSADSAIVDRIEGTDKFNYTNDIIVYAKYTPKPVEVRYNSANVTNATNFNVSATNAYVDNSVISVGKISTVYPNTAEFTITATRANTARNYYFDFSYDGNYRTNSNNTRNFSFNANQPGYIGLSVIEIMNVSAVKGDEGINTATFDWYWNNKISTLSYILRTGKVVYNATVKEGYTFDGWYNGDTKVSSDLTYTIESITEDATLTARTTANTYTVTLNANGGTVNPTSVKVTYNAKYGELPTPTKVATAQYSYTFAGWYLEETFETLVGSETVVTTAKDHTVYAKYTATKNSYSITWKDEDGTTLRTDTIEYGVTPSYGENPTKAATAEYSYTFGGWDPEVVAVTGDATYTATYTAEANTYTVTLNANGGTVNPTSVKVTYNAKYGELPTATKVATAQYSYTFAGWYLEETFETLVGSETVVTTAKDHTVYAKYTATKNSYSITWKDEDGTTLRTDTVEYGVTPSYGENPTKAATAEYSYTFGGWDPEVVAVTGDATYTATYTAEANTYTVTLDSMGGTVDSSYKTVTYNSTYGTLPTATKEGYAFTGWYLEETFETLVGSDTVITTASDHTLYAKWTPAPLSINYVSKNTANATNIAISVTNGSVSSTSIAYKETAIVTPTDATNFSVTLSRTNTSRNYYMDIYDGTWSGMVNEKTITFGTNRSNFIRINVHEYMNVNAVKGDEGIDTATFDYYWNNNPHAKKQTSTTTIVLHTGKVVYNATVKEGYEFDGWYNGNTKVSSDLTYTIESITEDITLTARTTANTYTVTLDSMGGTVDPTEIEVAYNSIYGTLPTPTKDKFIFAGWYLEDTFETLIVSTTKVTIAEDHTLYAKWDESPLIITYIVNGEAYNIEYINNITNEISLLEVSKTGYIFRGWYLERVTYEEEYRNIYEKEELTTLPANTMGNITLYGIFIAPDAEGYIIKGYNDASLTLTFDIGDGLKTTGVYGVVVIEFEDLDFNITRRYSLPITEKTYTLTGLKYDNFTIKIIITYKTKVDENTQTVITGKLEYQSALNYNYTITKNNKTGYYFLSSTVN